MHGASDHFLGIDSISRSQQVDPQRRHTEVDNLRWPQLAGTLDNVRRRAEALQRFRQTHEIVPFARDEKV